MKITPDNIKWSSYKDREGPFFPGVYEYELPPSASEEEEILAVVCAAEGGHYDAINMYDRGIVSVGLIQWIESGQHGVSNLLGHVATVCGDAVVTNALKPALDHTNSSFKKTKDGTWRFHNSNGDAIESPEGLENLFLGCDGKKGSWTPQAITRAKLWAAALANVWYVGGARAAQDSYTCKRIKSFVLSKARGLLYDPSVVETPWVNALRAAYVSYAVNLPSMAEKHLILAAQNAGHTKWSENWCLFVIKQLTFGPNIGIYKHRYNSIRPIVEKIWGVKLPKTADDLYAWSPKVEAQTQQQPEITQSQQQVVEQSQSIEGVNLPSEQVTPDASEATIQVQSIDKRLSFFDILQRFIGFILYLVGKRS